LDGVRGLVQKNSVDIHRYRRPGLACPASLGFALGASEDTTNKVGLAVSELNSALRMRQSGGGYSALTPCSAPKVFRTRG
jgi:hypothetical protein